MSIRANGPTNAATSAVAAVFAVITLAISLTPALAVSEAPTVIGNPAVVTGFDVDSPFTLVSEDGPGDPHIDTVGGRPPTAAEIAAVDASLDFGIVTPPAHMAYATAGSDFYWRAANNASPEDLDVHLRTLSYIPDDAVLVIKSVFEDFRDHLDMELPDSLWHEIDVSWDTNLPAGVLAGASTTSVTVSQDGESYKIPLALYELLGGTAATNNAPSMSITINANADWNMALHPTDHTISQYYLKTVLLHEVAHGLGFSTGFSTISSVDSSTPTPWSSGIYGQQNPGLPLNAHGSSLVQSNDLWFQNTDGTWERIFDPPTWQEGSSLSHLNEATYTYSPGAAPTPGALMTPYLQSGETSQIDGVVIGVLSRLGYATFLGPRAPMLGVSHGEGTATIAITPVESGAAHVPAETWTVQLVNSANTVIAQQTIAATERVVTVTGLQDNTAYTATVIASIDGKTSQVSVPFTTETDATLDPATAPPSSTETPSSSTSNQSGFNEPGLSGPGSNTADATSQCLVDGNAEQFELVTGAMESVYRLYCSYFLRLPDAEGFEYWLGQNSNGTDLRRISDFFADSNEFTARYGELTDPEYVRLTYVNVLERPPDEGGYDYWVSRMDDGLSRGDLTLFFSDSDEFRDRTHTSRMATG